MTITEALTARLTVLLAGAPLLALAPACHDDVVGNDEVGGSSDTGSSGTGSSGTGSSDTGSSDTGSSDTGSGDTDTAGDPLLADAGPDRYVLVDEVFELDGSASTGAVLYHWDFGDGTAQPAPSPEPTVSHSYATPGRYYPVLTVYDDQDNSLAANLTITATPPAVHQPRHSGTIAGEPSLDRVAVAVHDANQILIVARQGETFEVVARTESCAGPRTVSADHVGAPEDLPGGLIACPIDDMIQRFDWDGQLGPAVSMGRGTRPTAALRVGDRTFAALAGREQLAVLQGPDLFGDITTVDGFPDPRGLALWPDGRIAVSRWRSPDDQAELRLFDPETQEIELLTLAYDPTPASDTEIGGVPSYLDQILVSPIADAVAIPSLQANFLHGEYINGQALTFETTVRAVVSFLLTTPADGQGHVGAAEDFDRRKQFDNRGFAAAGVYASHGDYLFVAMRGSRGVERYDTLGGAVAGVLLDVGYAPSGLALSPDDRYLYVYAELSRELRIYDVSSFDVLPVPIATIATVEGEPLPPAILRGKQLFNDSFDPRLAKHGYIACAHCHLDGEADRRTWDFTDRGEGLRNTIALLGHGQGEGGDYGPIHWSANFDEIQDFEHDIRGPFGGTGLLADEDWNSGTVSTTLGDPKAGLSFDLDFLAGYVQSLDSFPRSPHRLGNGSLSPEAEAGKLLFESPALGCVDCHVGPRFSDSAWLAPATPLLHDVGTIGPGSGLRLGEPLLGLDTPTLHGLWNGPPYLHDGSAADLHAVLVENNPDDLHGVTSQLTPTQIDQLIAYLLSLEGTP